MGTNLKQGYQENISRTSNALERFPMAENRSDFVEEVKKTREILVGALEEVASASNYILQALARVDMLELEAYRLCHASRPPQQRPDPPAPPDPQTLCGGGRRGNRCQPVSPMVSGLVIQKPTVALRRLAEPPAASGSFGIALSPIPEEQEEEETSRIIRHRSRLGRRHQEREISLVSGAESLRELYVPLVRLSLPSEGRPSWVLQEREEESEDGLSEEDDGGSGLFHGWPPQAEPHPPSDFKPKTESIPFEESGAEEGVTANMIGNTATLQIPAGTSVRFITKMRRKTPTQSRRSETETGEPVAGTSAGNQTAGEATPREEQPIEVRKRKTPVAGSVNVADGREDATPGPSSKSQPGSVGSGSLKRNKSRKYSGTTQTPNTDERGSAKSARSSCGSSARKNRSSHTPDSGISRTVQTRSSSSEEASPRSAKGDFPDSTPLFVNKRKRKRRLDPDFVP